jgi:hypothetical protein
MSDKIRTRVMSTLSEATLAIRLRPEPRLQRAARLIALWRRPAAERRMLALLDERSLRDIGFPVSTRSTKRTSRSGGGSCSF